MSNVASRGHGRGKPNPGYYSDHNAMQQEPQFVKPYVGQPGQMNFQPRMGPNQMPPQQQFYGQSYQNQHNNYYQPQHNQPPPLHQQQQYGGYNRQEYVPQQMYNPQYPPYQGHPPVYQSDTVNYSQTPQPQTMSNPAQPEPRRQRKVLEIVDPTTKKAIDVPQPQAPPPPVAPQVPLAPEDEKKKEHINQEMLEKVKKQLTGENAHHLPNFNVPPPMYPSSHPVPQQQAPPQVAPQVVAPQAPAPQAPAPQVAPQVIAPPKTPEAPVKSVETPKEPEVLTPVSSPQTPETTTPASTTAESVSAISDARVTPTLQKEESKEEVEDDKFDEDERVETPETESLAEKTPEEIAEEKAQKEAEEKEKKRLHEESLEKQIAELIKSSDADVSNGVFGRAFMVTIRELEKNFSRTPCPLTPAQLTDFGLDLKTMRVAEKKANFTPNWVVNKGGNARPSYRGRTTTDGTGRGAQPRDRGSHNKRPPVVRQSIERMQRIALPSSKDAWKPDRQKAGDGLPEEEAAIAKVCKNVRALMNKVTPTSQGPLTKEFISFNVSSNEKQLAQVVQIVFDKAVEEPKFCALYAEMCKSQVNHELNLNNGKSAFRNTILTRTQTFFQDKRDIDEEKVAVIEKEEDPVKREAMMIEEKQKFRRRKFGVMAFIGHLYRNTLLSTKIVQACTLELFGSILPKKVDDKEQPLKKEDIDEESVHCGLQLIETVGQMLDKAKEMTPVFLDQWLEKLNTAKPLCTNKIRFMIMNLIELRKEKWIPRKSTESGPKKIDEIHKDIRQEKIENEKARDQYDRDRDRRHGGVRPNSNSLKKPLPVSRNSLDRNRQHPEQKRAAAAANTKLASSNVQPKNISLSAMSDNSILGGKKKEWQSGASGGGNTSESASAAPQKSAWGQRRDSNDQRKRSTADERQSALAAAKELSGPMSMSARRSASQNSLPDKIDEEASEEQQAARVKIMNTVKSDIQEVVTGDLSLKEMVDSFGEYVDKSKEKYGKPTLTIVYEMIIRAVSEKAMKEDERKKLACALRMSLVSKVEKQAFIDGVTRFCKFAVDTELYQDYPKVWEVTAEVVLNTMHVRHDLIEETKVETISLNEMLPAFQAAVTEGNKKYALLVQFLKRWTDAELEETNKVDMLNWEFHELSMKEEMLKNGLRSEMEAVKASNDKTLAEQLIG